MRRWLLLAAVALTACSDRRESPRATPPRLPLAPPAPPKSQTVTVRGVVIDRDIREVVPDVEVVLRGEHGDVAARTDADGAFAVDLVRGDYRAFVRDARMLSVGVQRRIRLRTLPQRELAGAPDEALMPVLSIDDDTSGIEIGVVAGAQLSGTVLDANDRPVGDAVVHAMVVDPFVTAPGSGPPIARRTSSRPVLGTDTAISDADGQFLLRVPAGRYALLGSHAQFAGAAQLGEVEVIAGQKISPVVVLVRGCVISGRVVGARGPAHDGAIEVGGDFLGFGPAGRVAPDGTFRWTTTEDGPVVLRAWPWMSPPSPAQTFACSDGRRFDNVVLRVGNARPDLGGTLIDAQGHPVPLAFLDITPLDRGVGGQQERADASGAWHVYDMPAGRYQITATAPGRGVITTVVVAPRTDILLQLGGTGRLAGTTPAMVDGSFELAFHQCGPSTNPVEIDDDPRIVVVRGGRFSVDRVPACALTFSARWRDKVITGNAVVEPDRTSWIQLELGEPIEKQVHGTVRDASGKPVARARVTAVVDTHETTSVRTDDDGKFSLRTQAGAQLVAGNGRRVGRAPVGHANVPSEQVDLVLDE